MHPFAGLFDPGEGNFVDPFSEFFFEGRGAPRRGQRKRWVRLSDSIWGPGEGVGGGVNSSPKGKKGVGRKRGRAKPLTPQRAGGITASP